MQIQITGKTKPDSAQAAFIRREIEGLMNRLGFKPSPVAQFNISGTIKSPGDQPHGVHLKGVRSGTVDCAIYTAKGAFEGFLILDKSKKITGDQIMSQYQKLPPHKIAPTPTTRKGPTVRKTNLAKEGFINTASLGCTRIPGYRGRRQFSSSEEYTAAIKLAGHLDTIRQAQATLITLIEERKTSEKMKSTYEALRARQPQRHDEITSSIKTLTTEISATSINIQTQQRIIETAQRAIEQLG